MRTWIIAVALVCMTAAVGFGAASVVSAASSPQARVHVGFTLGRFLKQGRSLVALGAVTETATLPDGSRHTVSKPFRARVATRGFRVLQSRTCSVLDLTLDKLSLTLLGLNVNLGKVVLTINGNARGGALGSLFCQLAHARVKLRGLASYARRLTHAVHKSGLSSTSDSLLGFSVPVRQFQASTTGGTVVCPILDLILGPLHLNLLGLIVNLNQVHLTITASPGGGALGSLFCSLAGATTTAPATTT